jgi:hypothetical protein
MEIEIFFDFNSCFFSCLGNFKSCCKTYKEIAMKKFFICFFIFIFVFVLEISLVSSADVLVSSRLFCSNKKGEYYFEVKYTPPASFSGLPYWNNFQAWVEWGMDRPDLPSQNYVDGYYWFYPIHNRGYQDGIVYNFTGTLSIHPVYESKIKWRLYIDRPYEWRGISAWYVFSYPSQQVQDCSTTGLKQIGVPVVSVGSFFKMSSFRAKGVGGYEIRY